MEMDFHRWGAEEFITTGSLMETRSLPPPHCVQFLAVSDEQPEASNVACDYSAGPVPWKIGSQQTRYTPRVARGCQGLFGLLL